MNLGFSLSVCSAIAHVQRFSPLALDPVVWLDPSDPSTLFQDRAGTVPVAAMGDPVGVILDKSGHGNHLTASSDSARPTYHKSHNFAVAPNLVVDPWVETGALQWEGAGVSLVADTERAYQGTHCAKFTGNNPSGYFRIVGLTGVTLGEVISYGMWVYVGTEDATGSIGWAGSGGWGKQEISEIPVGTWTYITATADARVTGSANLEIRTPSANLENQLWIDGLQIARGGDESLFFHSLAFDGVGDTMATAGALPFSPSLFNCTSFQIDSYNTAFPSVLSSRGRSSGSSQYRQPMINLTENSPNTVWVHFGSGLTSCTMASSILGRPLVVSGSIDGAGQCQAGVDGIDFSSTVPVLIDGGTEPFEVSGGSRYEGQFFGCIQASAIPTNDQIAQIRSFYAEKSGGIA